MPGFRSTVVLGALLVAGLTLAARAQDMGNGFLFGAPTGSVVVRGGWAAASAGSDLFSFTTDQLTLKRGDFSSPSGDFDLAFNVTPRTQIVTTVTAAFRSKRSEFRHFIDNNDLPIEQTTNFVRVPITIGIKQYLTSTGRSIGKFAWIPSRFAPYVGAGGGVMYYRFRQSGDWVDFNTMDVFAAQYESDGWNPTANVETGIDYSLSPRFALTGEARYVWSKASLSQDFTGFQKLDLSGFSTSIGVAVRY
jgi:outer membrane protein W